MDVGEHVLPQVLPQHNQPMASVFPVMLSHHATPPAAVFQMHVAHHCQGGSNNSATPLTKYVPRHVTCSAALLLSVHSALPPAPDDGDVVGGHRPHHHLVVAAV